MELNKDSLNVIGLNHIGLNIVSEIDNVKKKGTFEPYGCDGEGHYITTDDKVYCVKS